VLLGRSKGRDEIWVHLLAMSGEAILVGIDRDGVHGEFVGCAEDSDGNFLDTDEHEKGHDWEALRAHTPRLATRILVRGPP